MGKKKNTLDMMPDLTGQGNAMPMAITSFFIAVVFLTFGFILLFGEIEVTSSGLVESPIVNKVIAFVIMLLIALFLIVVGFGFFKTTRFWHKFKKRIKKQVKRWNKYE